MHRLYCIIVKYIYFKKSENENIKYENKENIKKKFDFKEEVITPRKP